MAAKLSKRELRALTDELKRLEVPWQAIYLFGSTAKGWATSDSDRDICIIVPNKTAKLDRIWIKLSAALGMRGFDFDILLTTTKDFEKNRLSPILHEIRTSGTRVA